MINRSNELIYVKRNYFFPFKPLMDYEYKKFGYKKCDKSKGKEKYINTAYYVRHKERPMGLCDVLYYLNLPLSYFRALAVPVLIAIFLASILIEGITSLDLMLDKQLILLVLSLPIMLLSVFLSNMGYNAYRNNETNGKLDRIMKSRGWPAWTSYKDNDPRFTPPGSHNSAPAGNPSRAANDMDDDDTITLTAANGEEITFTEIACIAHKGNFYAILQPVELIDGMADDEALVFKVVRGPDGSDSFEIELDDAIVDAVFKEYDRLYDETPSK